MVRQVETLENQVNGTLYYEHLLAALLGFFGLLAMLLVCVGLYGLMSYSVARRTQEIGIRMALGARRGQALGMVLKSTVMLVVIGIVVGLPIVLFTTRLVEHFLFGVKPFDPATIALAAASLFLVSVIAAYLPARRASRIDPALALRQE
ncbi:MAG: FtsX-like permease family protein [Planctomycetaceae bacterium]|nr:MAG: FtsX-like permease family protein [Planctomycetaceae bacterium]